MDAPQPGFDWLLYAWRLLVTVSFVLLNGFFVSAEFALVKVRPTRIEQLAESGEGGARAARHVLQHLDRYLSACQLGITVASLILGWLAEPAVAELLLAGAAALDLGVAADDPWLHWMALAIALTLVTILHMTLGEQAPKLWAIHRAEATSLRVAVPLRGFAAVFRPFIWVINELSNALLRSVGLSAAELQEAASHSADELKLMLASSAGSGHITNRQLELARNVIDIIELEVRHILVPRVDVVFLSLQNPPEENLRIMRESGHSRFPLCAVGLDTVIGIVHTKEVLLAAGRGEARDLRALARKPIFVSDTQSVSRLIIQLQRSRNHCSVVVDEHGTAIGLAFLEDCLEEIVGPIRDEFDDVEPELTRLATGAIEMPGSLALPEAEDELEVGDLGEEADTIGGYVVAQLGRLPRDGDTLEIGPWAVTVLSVRRRRVERLRFERREAQPGEGSA